MAKSSGPSRETKAHILERTEREKVKFMRLQFTDILGTIKNVEIPDRQFEAALDGKIMFDEPSNMIFPSSAASNCRSGISTFLIVPRMSKSPTGSSKRRSTGRSCSTARRSTD